MLSIGTQKRDRITTITDTTWAEYISLDLPSKRVSFRNGVITIMSPGRNHVYRESGYLELTTSNSLPNLNSDRIKEYRE